MENSVEKGSFGGTENSKKTKCLDLQSLYKTEALRKGPSKEGNFSEQNEVKVGDNKKKRKKSKVGRGAALDGFMTVGKRSRKGLDVENVSRVGPGPVLTDTGKSLPESCHRNGLSGIALNLAENGNIIHIPKRPRGFVGRKKSEVISLAKTGGSSSSVHQVGRLSGELIKSESLGSSIAEAGSSDKKGKSVTSSIGNAGDSVAVPSSHGKKVKLVNSSPGNAGESIAVPGSHEKKVNLHTSSSGSAGDSAATTGNCDKNAKLVTSSAGNAGEPVVASHDKKVKLVINPAGNARKLIAKAGNDDKNAKFTGSTANAGESKIKRKRAVCKETKDRRANSAIQAKAEGCDVTVNNGDASRKLLNNFRKRRDFPSGSKSSLKKVDEPSAENSGRDFDDFQDDYDDEDDEENLERNAARMLSSRFDPRCTGFSSKNRTSREPSEGGLSFPDSSGRDFVCRDDSATGLRSLSPNADSRVLRPRNQLKKKGLSRKRRHFYEVLASNFDSHWFLNQRIKVFWPLDESWYYGLVNDYDPETKLHHVKYDDRDEEWINLHNEKFKLLLLPSEVPGRRVRRRSSMSDKYVNKEKRDLSEDDDHYAGTYLDSEPIISWLARPSRRIKSSPSSVKKQKTVQSSPPVIKSDDRGQSVDPLTDNRSKYGCCSELPARSADTERVENSLLGSPSSSKAGSYVVYFRKRFRKKGQQISHAIYESKEMPRILKTFNSSGMVFNGKWKTSSLGCYDADKLCWLVDDQGLLKLKMPLLESMRFNFYISLPVLPFMDYSFRNDQFLLSWLLMLPQYGAIMTTWPEVFLEMLFVDNTIGLRFFLFEVSLKQAVTLFSLILSVFTQPSGELKFFDMQLPLTSIRFRLSCIHHLGRQEEFTFYSFSKLRHTTWLYMDSQLQRHCLFTKKLPLSDCTYDNIKSLEGGSNQLFTSFGESGPYCFKKRFLGGIQPMGVSREYVRTKMHQSSCNSAVKFGKLPIFALSFAAAPTFFLSLHLKLLMEHNFASISLQGSDSLGSSEYSGATVEFPEVHTGLENVPDTVPGSYVGVSSESTTAEPGSCMSAAVAGIEDGKQRPQDLENGNLNIMLNSPAKDSKKNETAAGVLVPGCKSDNQESAECVVFAAPSVPNTVASPRLSQVHSSSAVGRLSIELPSFDQNDVPFDGPTKFCSQASDFAGNVSDSAAGSPYPTVHRSSWDHDRDGSISSPFGDLSPVWPDGKSNFIRSGFGNGPRKPRTQVRYSLPQGGYDFSLKHKSLNRRSFPHKRIRRSNEKRISDGLKVPKKNLDTLSCDANVLVTLREKGWRESGAFVVLELTDHNEWRLAVKVSGVTKYSHKVNHILQPGSTNRYTHAMMWKGGKEWVLEFPDRSQWVIFKEMYEECYNRNIRAASVKNIPIPGVRLVEESDDYITDLPSVRNSPNYMRQIESDVEMALNPSHILYDIDSDDEQWILRYGKSYGTDENKYEGVSDELFEKTMDMLEKIAYSQQRDHFTIDELEDLMVEVDSIEIIEAIYEHWQQKRQAKGMPLIRHLQPPLWERYQQQVKEWEEAVARANTSSSSGCKDKSASIEKPPMFAFCLKPRGLEIPNKGSKQRSQKRFSVSGHHQVISGDQDRLHNFDVSPLLHQSARVFSHRDGGMNNFSMNGDLSEWNHYTKFQRNKLKKTGGLSSPNNQQLVVSHNQRTAMRNGVHKWNMELSDWPNQRYHHYDGTQRYGIEQLDGSDFHEFRLRDASSAAQHARNMAKLKREKAQRLLYRADLAIHKAAVALMTAEAIKAASDSSNHDG